LRNFIKIEQSFQHPTALRLTISLHHAKSDVLDSLLGDLKKCCEKILTEPGYEYPSKTVRNKGHLSFLLYFQNVIFGISAAFTDRGVADQLPFAYLDAYYSTPTAPQGEGGMRKRTLSIEGRKLSQLQMPSGFFLFLVIKY
jgi:hypothetical protein